MIGTISIRTVDALPVGEALWDAGHKNAVRGFGVRKQLRAAVYVVKFRVRGRQRFYTIGAHGSPWTPDTARREAKRVLGMVAAGVDPCATKAQSQQGADTLQVVIDRYLAVAQQRQRPRSHYETRHYLLKSWSPLHGMSVFDVRRRDVAQRVAEIAVASGNVSASRARTALSAVFGWAIREGWELPANPVAGSNCPPAPKPRERVLYEGELRSIWGALPDTDYGSIVRLLLLTGQRRNEVGGMQWSEIKEDGTWVIPAARCKNGREHSLPLSPMAQRIISAQPRRTVPPVFGEGARGFNNWGHAKAGLDKRIGDEVGSGWVLHDIRRTVATMMVDRLGVLPHVVEAILNHASGHRSGVAGIYNRARYSAEMREALDRWALEVSRIVEGRPRPITLRRVAVQRVEAASGG
jgi:integrase